VSQIRRPGRLVIDEHGFSQHAVWRSKRFLWRDVDGFCVFRTPFFNPIAFVGFNDHSSGVTRASALAPGWSASTNELIAALEAGKVRWTGTQ